MKRSIKFFAVLIITLAHQLISTSSFAQAPQKMSYQAVIRNTSNELVADKQVGMQISILQGSATGTVVYSEIQTPTTNVNGLVTIEVGIGPAVIGNFTSIDWANGPYYIKTETDPEGGTSYSITGTSQMLSVPYALYSGTAESLNGCKKIRLDYNSSTNDPQLLLNETESDFSRVSFSNSKGSSFWSIAGLNDATTASERLNFYNSTFGDVLSLTGEGKVGIGTTSPAAKLDVTGNVKIADGTQGSGKVLTSDADGLASWQAPAGSGISGTTNYLSKFDNSGAALTNSTIFENGNVGIGTTSPAAKLQIDFNSFTQPQLLLNETENDYARLGFACLLTDGNRWTLAGKPAANGANQDAYFNLFYSGLGADVLSIKGNGNILAGTTSDVRNVYYSTADGTSGTAKLTVSSHNRMAGYFETDTVDYTGNFTAVLVGKYTGNYDQAATGVLGISCPNILTTCGGAGRGGYFIGGRSGVVSYCYGGADDGYKYGVYSCVSGSGTAAKYGIYTDMYYASGGTNYAAYFIGDVHYTGTLTGPSDKKFKENIIEYVDALSGLMKVKTYSFNYKNDGEAKSMRLAGGKQLGFVAQQLEEVFPELVKNEINVVQLRDEKTGKPTGKTEEIKYKGVNYIGMIPVLTKAIQEQQAIIEDLKKQIEVLNAKIGITE